MSRPEGTGVTPSAGFSVLVQYPADMLELDGEDAGGQFVRSAVALSALTGDPIRVENVRGDRPEPGLRPQHLAAVRTAQRICDADVDGDEQGSETVAFEPGEPTGGRYAVDIGTAGSITLLFDTLLPLALAIDEPLRVTATGGTDVKWSPSLAYSQRVKFPLLRRFGLQAAVDRDRTGFYPVGGGEATLSLAPAALSPLSLTDRGDLQGVRVYSRAATDLADADVPQRQADAIVRALEGEDLEMLETTVSTVETASPGSVCLVRADYENTVAGFDALGEKGKPAEDVGRTAVEQFSAFEGGSGAVDRHMADQLLVFLAVAGGEIVAPAVTDHVRTSIDLLDAFGYAVSVEEMGDRVALSAPGD
jgi:RNA 3'-terminal phosphate cyclase (ATP)